MKNYITLILCLSIFTFFSCQKDNDDFDFANTPCEEEKWGHLKITNTQGEAYRLFVDGQAQATIKAGESYLMESISEGLHNIRTEEVDYIVFPDVFEGNANVVRCTTNEYEF